MHDHSNMVDTSLGVQVFLYSEAAALKASGCDKPGCGQQRPQNQEGAFLGRPTDYMQGTASEVEAAAVLGNNPTEAPRTAQGPHLPSHPGKQGYQPECCASAETVGTPT